MTRKYDIHVFLFWLCMHSLYFGHLLSALNTIVFTCEKKNKIHVDQLIGFWVGYIYHTL